MNHTEQPDLWEGRRATTMILRWWKGEERLVIVYWSSMAILAALYFLGLAAEHAPDNSAIVVFLVQICVYAFCAFSIWACAFNAKRRVWGYLVRIQVGAGIISSIGHLLRGVS